MDKYHPEFQENQFYHIYNRGNNRENIFFRRKNFSYFILNYEKYLIDYLNTYAYCLIPNHFHLLVKIKEKDLILFKYKKASQLNVVIPNLNITDIISNQFRKFFISYSLSINVQEKRSGSLFLKNFKRKQVQGNLERLIFYIHNNPVHHKISAYEEYEWSPYKEIINNPKNKNEYIEILEWFGGEEEFVKYHKESSEDELLRELEYDEF
jgi:REP element-mobilizing transposase RayT